MNKYNDLVDEVVHNIRQETDVAVLPQFAEVRLSTQS